MQKVLIRLSRWWRDRSITKKSRELTYRTDSVLENHSPNQQGSSGETVDELRRILKEREALETALRELIKTYEELTIPALIASHEMLSARWEREALIQTLVDRSQKAS